MPGPPVLDRLVGDVTRQIRLRRAEFYGLRGLFWGAVVAVLPLLLKESLGLWSYAGAILLLAGAGRSPVGLPADCPGGRASSPTAATDFKIV
jgi:hypothetical protein